MMMTKVGKDRNSQTSCCEATGPLQHLMFTITLNLKLEINNDVKLLMIKDKFDNHANKLKTKWIKMGRKMKELCVKT